MTERMTPSEVKHVLVKIHGDLIWTAKEALGRNESEFFCLVSDTANILTRAVCHLEQALQHEHAPSRRAEANRQMDLPF